MGPCTGNPNTCKFGCPECGGRKKKSESAIKWKPIDTAPENKFILVACKSGYMGIEWIYRVAQFTSGYIDRWDDEGNVALKDIGHEPLYWTELPNPPEDKT
jgi:hypothetical protein